MAKTTSTTKAKTKTTKKKPTVKTAAKTAKTAAKNTKAVATKAKKTTVKSAAKTTKTTKSTIKAASPTKVSKSNTATAGVFSRPQMVFGAAFALLALLAGFFMKNDSVQVLLGHLTKDELASRAGTVLAPAAHVLYEVEYRWLVVGFLVLATVLAVLRATRYKAVEDNGTKNRVQPLRWVDYGLTGAAAFSIAGLLNGLQDVVALKLAAISIVVAAYLGWVYEREAAVDGKAARSLYIGSAVLTIAPVAFLAVTMLATNIYGMVRSPWYAYAAAAVVAIYLLGTTRMQWNATKKAYGFAFVDRNYNRLAVVSKVAIAAVLIIGLYSK